MHHESNERRTMKTCARKKRRWARNTHALCECVRLRWLNNSKNGDVRLNSEAFKRWQQEIDHLCAVKMKRPSSKRRRKMDKEYVFYFFPFPQSEWESEMNLVCSIQNIAHWIYLASDQRHQFIILLFAVVVIAIVACCISSPQISDPSIRISFVRWKIVQCMAWNMGHHTQTHTHTHSPAYSTSSS